MVIVSRIWLPVSSAAGKWHAQISGMCSRSVRFSWFIVSIDAYGQSQRDRSCLPGRTSRPAATSDHKRWNVRRRGDVERTRCLGRVLLRQKSIPAEWTYFDDHPRLPPPRVLVSCESCNPFTKPCLELEAAEILPNPEIGLKEYVDIHFSSMYA